MESVRRVGPYAKLLANYASDDAIIAAGEAAELLFVRGLAFCATSDSDGYITTSQLLRFVGAGMRDVEKRATRLVEQGLWGRDGDGYQIRSWTKINETAEEKGRKRRTDRERKRDSTPDGFRSDSVRNPSGIQADSESSGVRNRHNRLLNVGVDVNAVQSIDAPETESGATKPRDKLFDAVAAECGIEPKSLTESGRGALNAALKQLRSVEATPGQVKVRAQRYRRQFEHATLTAPALAKHWASLGVESVPAQRVSGDPATAWMRGDV